MRLPSLPVHRRQGQAPRTPCLSLAVDGRGVGGTAVAARHGASTFDRVERSCASNVLFVDGHGHTLCCVVVCAPLQQSVFETQEEVPPARMVLIVASPTPSLPRPWFTLFPSVFSFISPFPSTSPSLRSFYPSTFSPVMSTTCHRLVLFSSFRFHGCVRQRGWRGWANIGVCSQTLCHRVHFFCLVFVHLAGRWLHPERVTH